MNFRQLLQAYYYPHFNKSLLVGPDIAGNLLFVTGFLKTGLHAVDAVTFHHYYGGGDSFTKVDDFVNLPDDAEEDE